MAGYNHPNTLVGAPVGTSAVTAVGNPYAAPGAMQNYYDQRSAANNAAAWGTAGVPTGANPPQQHNPYALTPPPSIDWGALLGGGSFMSQQAMPSYSSGIDAGPIYSPQQAQAAQGAIANVGAPAMSNMPGVSGAQSSGLADALRSGVQGQAQMAATGFGRDVSGANAKHQLATETARASDGLRSAALMQQMIAQQNQMQLQAQNRILDLLGNV